MSSGRSNNDQPESSREENVPMPLIRECFEHNRNVIKSKGCVDAMKTNEKMKK